MELMLKDIQVTNIPINVFLDICQTTLKKLIKWEGVCCVQPALIYSTLFTSVSSIHICFIYIWGKQ